MLTYTMEPRPGEEIRDAALRASRHADEKDVPVVFTFNDTQLRVEPGEGYPEVVERYLKVRPQNWDH